MEQLIKLEGMEAVVDSSVLQKRVFDIDFGGQMKVQFTKDKSGEIRATNGMNGYGQNIANEIAGKQPEISTPPITGD